MLEIFKLIEGYPNYAISNFGRVYSLKRNKYLKHMLNNYGYYHVKLNKKSIKIHRLLAIHFIPNALQLPCVDHIDRDKTNNQLNNLRWATFSMNCQNTTVRKTNKLKIKNISYCKTKNGYVFSKSIRGIKHQKRFKTLEEAIEYKQNFKIPLYSVSQK
jgi:hypothetical protein